MVTTVLILFSLFQVSLTIRFRVRQFVENSFEKKLYGGSCIPVNYMLISAASHCTTPVFFIVAYVTPVAMPLRGFTRSAAWKNKQ